MTELRSASIGWQEETDEFENYLRSKIGNAQFIAEQMKKVEAHFKPWLLDKEGCRATCGQFRTDKSSYVN